MATERRKRQERRERRAAVPPPDPGRIAPAPVPANRGTFRVAQAQRQLSLDMPGLVRAMDRPKRQGEAKRSPSAASEAPRLGQGEGHRSPSRPAERNRPAPLTMEKADPRLKCRPKDSRPKSGGSGRSFVPWGNC